MPNWCQNEITISGDEKASSDQDAKQEDKDKASDEKQIKTH